MTEPLDRFGHAALAAAAAKREPAAPDAPRFRCAADLARDPSLMAPPEILVSPLAAAGRVTLLSLGPKSGKSTTAAGLIAAGTRAGVRCSLLTLDEALPDSLQRLARFEADLDLAYIADVFDAGTLEAEQDRLGVQVLVVDHLGKLAEQDPDFGAGSQGDPLLWGRLVSPFTNLARDRGLAVVLLDQARKSDGKYAGSFAKAAGVDILAEMELKDGALVCTPRGRVPLPAFRVELDDEGIPHFTAARSDLSAEAAPDGRARELLQLLSDSEPEGLTYAGWLKMSEVPKASFNRNRKALLRAGLALSPNQTRGRYHITDKGESSLSVSSVPLGTTGTNGTSREVGTIGTKPLIGFVPREPFPPTVSTPDPLAVIVEREGEP